MHLLLLVFCFLLLRLIPPKFNLPLGCFGLDPAETVFIDDREQNVKAAEQFGITGILCDTHENVRKELQCLALL
jgi:2-haloacid dehalogenase